LCKREKRGGREIKTSEKRRQGETKATAKTRGPGGGGILEASISAGLLMNVTQGVKDLEVEGVSRKKNNNGGRKRKDPKCARKKENFETQKEESTKSQDTTTKTIGTLWKRASTAQKNGEGKL